MTSEEKPYICHRGRKYRDIERRLKNTYGEGDCVRVVDVEQEEPMVDTELGEMMVDDRNEKQFGEALLRSVQDLARQIDFMG